MNLKGRRALITGATGSLGRVMADALAELGADLVLVDRPGSDFQSLTDTLIQHWGAPFSIAFATWSSRISALSWWIG